MPSWPWTFASLPAGNVAASKLDDNFNAAMFSAGSSTNGAVPTWNGTGGNALNTGGLVLGSGATNIPQVQSNGLLPTGVGAAAAYVSASSAGTIQASANVASVTKTGTGIYEVNFTNVAPSVSYVTVVCPEGGNPGLFATVLARTAAKTTILTANTATQTAQDCGFDLVCFW